jgi:anti-sigma-K factor RskA
MGDMDHAAQRDAAGLYALGALAGADRDAFEAHLATCEECAAEVRSLGAVVHALPYAAPQVDPPAALRARVLAAAGDPNSSSRGTAAVTPMPAGSSSFAAPGWLAAAALVLLTLGLGAYTVNVRQRVGGLETQLGEALARLDRSEQQLAEAVRASERAQSRLAVLTAPDLRQVSLAGQPAAPRAAGRALWSRTNGLLFAANDLPPLPAGRIYQVWFLTPGAPVSAGLVRPDANGRVTASFDTPAGTPEPTGVAVSIEPEAGVPAPTGALYLAGTATQ